MMGESLEPFLNILRRAGWKVVIRPDAAVDLSATVWTRYPQIPEAYLEFLHHVSECTNAAQNAWFLCEQDFSAPGLDDTAFRWNEWERIGLDAAAGDDQVIRGITHFWDSHLPIMSAVHFDYAYLAISLAPAEYGSVVYGYGPEFETSPITVCGSFDEFLGLFGRVVAGELPVEYQDSAGNRLIRRELWDFL